MKYFTQGTAVSANLTAFVGAGAGQAELARCNGLA